MLELVPVGTDDERQAVLKVGRYYEDGMTPIDAFHAATAENRRLSILGSDRAYDSIDVVRSPLEPDATDETDE